MRRGVVLRGLDELSTRRRVAVVGCSVCDWAEYRRFTGALRHRVPV